MKLALKGALILPCGQIWPPEFHLKYELSLKGNEAVIQTRHLRYEPFALPILTGRRRTCRIW